MAVRTVTAAAVLATAAVVVCVLVRRDRGLRRKLVRERVSHRLIAGCLVHDLEVFRRRLAEVVGQQAVVGVAGLVRDEALARHECMDPSAEGGPR